jgi:hypothetical protein
MLAKVQLNEITQKLKELPPEYSFFRSGGQEHDPK